VFYRKAFNEIEQKLGILLDAIDKLYLITEKNMSVTNQGLADLQAALAAETVQSALVVTTLGAIGAQVATLQAQVAALQAQLAAGVEVTDSQLEAMATTLNTAESTVTAALPKP
jgi:hypothetical protein